MMERILATLIAACGLVIGLTTMSANAQERPDYAMVIHGGAGTITRADMTEETEAAYRAKLTEALETGAAVLADGGDALDAVTATITLMEDSPLFNAGKGAVYTAQGRNELDASIMDGKTLNAGAVSGVTRIKNPILLARAVMAKSRHVMLSGSGAEAFAAEQGFDFVSPLYFHTERRFNQILTIQREGRDEALLDADTDHKYGTVGVAALDMNGDLAAGTSTGGLTNKLYGRIGDSPIIGAGTYANNASCAVSGTGTGEYFIRLTIARDICALMEYADMSLAEAADKVIHENLTNLGGDGGIIALDKDGNIVAKFNTEGMYRGAITAGGEPVTGIYKDDAL